MSDLNSVTLTNLALKIPMVPNLLICLISAQIAGFLFRVRGPGIVFAEGFGSGFGVESGA